MTSSAESSIAGSMSFGARIRDGSSVIVRRISRTAPFRTDVLGVRRRLSTLFSSRRGGVAAAATYDRRGTHGEASVGQRFPWQQRLTGIPVDCCLRGNEGACAVSRRSTQGSMGGHRLLPVQHDGRPRSLRRPAVAGSVAEERPEGGLHPVL